MSRIDDDNSDMQRIREMNEAALRRKVDDEKRGVDSRLRKSFDQVMSERSRGEQSKKASDQQGARKEAEAKPKTGQDVLARVRAQGPRQQAELARRAALSRSLAGEQAGRRTQDGVLGKRAEEARTSDLLKRTEDEGTFVERERRSEEEREVRLTEEKQADAKQAAHGEAPVERRDEGRKQNRDRGKEDEKKAEVVASAGGPRAAHVVQIPKEIIDKLVAAIQSAVGPDGRTSMQLTLKGSDLDGVKLHITAENGAVSCQLEGVNPRLGRMIEQSRSVLDQALKKRGLRLVALKAR